ncbi:MAG: C39 family peptidase [Peptostreptococcus sp.]|uniref:C39 family peptidase n=1 Tax=Peptostreptococcus sp. TaxID=1262 RepID=UPI001CACB7A8|nr:C39 family peptidase [Peptostreptococcus sp.]MBF1057190.1 C39 family peptidase [Peptostreptococcus sp.]
MASKKDTKYTFKGNNKKVDNKYANIYEDLSNKDKLYEENSLKKLHKDENNDINKIGQPVVRELSLEEAEKNAKMRKQAMLNEKQIAIQKSSPVVNHTMAQSYDRIESLERLKREKEASRLGQDVDNPEYIKQKAKERANMDKSDVEIYKEYSDFDRSSEPRDEEDSELSVADIEKGLSQDSEADDFKTKKIENLIEALSKHEDERPTERLPKVRQTRRSPRPVILEDDVRIKENEIEELLRRRKIQEREESSKMTRAERKQARKKAKENKRDTTTSNPNSAYRSRLDVYKNNAKKNAERINFKRLGLLIIGIVLVAVLVATGIDMLKHKLGTSTPTKTTTKTSSKTSTSTSKTKSTATASKTATKEEKIKKLEAIKGKLNSQEAERLDYIIKNIDSYPDTLIDLVARNHETVDFVYSYKDREKYNNRKLSADINSSYYVDGDVPLFLQWDRRWGYRIYGKEMIGLSGCGPTSLAMVIRHFDSDSTVNPYDVAKYSQDNGYVSADNFTSWKLFETGLSKYGLESQDVIPVEAKMKKALDDNKILIVSVKPGTFTERGHIIVIKGYNKNGDFLINDPNSIVNTNKTWSFDELKSEIRKIWGVSSKGSTSSSAKSNTKSGSDNTSSSSNSSSSSSDDTSSSSDGDASIIQDID